MSPQLGYHDWPTKSEAAQALGCSVRQVERMIEAGAIITGFRPVPHRRAACVCNPDDITRVAGERRAAAQPQSVVRDDKGMMRTLPEVDIAAVSGSISGLSRVVMRELLGLASDGARATVAASNPQAVPLSQKAYLTLDQAIEYSGLPKAELNRRMKMGLLETVRAGRWYIRRKSLDTL
jgi:hypothetical protein